MRSSLPGSSVIFLVSQYVTDILLASIEVYRGNEPISVAADVEYNPNEMERNWWQGWARPNGAAAEG